MMEMKRSNKSLPSSDMCEKIPVLLEKYHGTQMANIWKFGTKTGLRLTEILALELNNISDEQSFMKMHNARTGETQEVPLPREALEVVNSIKKAHPRSKYLFQSLRSRNVTRKKAPSPLTRQAVSLAFREVGQILGIPLTPHVMRQIYLVRTIDLFSLSERELVKNYLTADSDPLQQIFQNYFEAPK